MAKLMDINPFKRGETHVRKMGGFNLAPPDSGIKKLRNLCLDYCGNRGWAYLLALAAILLVWKLLSAYGFFPPSTFPAVDKNKWQTVSLTNSQVYFGHLKEINRSYVSLSNTYYLRAEQLKSSSSQNQISLVKLGNEVHGPEDVIYIPKEQIIFWENLKSDSQIKRLIEQSENEK